MLKFTSTRQCLLKTMFPPALISNQCVYDHWSPVTQNRGFKSDSPKKSLACFQKLPGCDKKNHPVLLYLSTMFHLLQGTSVCLPHPRIFLPVNVTLFLLFSDIPCGCITNPIRCVLYLLAVCIHAEITVYVVQNLCIPQLIACAVYSISLHQHLYL